jgi:hypothetical protein
VSTLNVDKVDPSTGTALEIGTSGDTVTVPSGATFNVAGTMQSGGVTVANTPAFQAYMSANQVISNDTDTVLQFNTEEYDTAGDYDTSTYKFTPQTAGKYFIYATCAPSGDANSALQVGIFHIRKNDSRILESRTNFNSNNGRTASQQISIVMDLNGSSDYVHLIGNVAQSGGTPTIEAGQRFSVFGAYKLIGV